MANPSKPFSVTATYLLNPEPSPLSAPFYLTATYDENAGDETRFIESAGFESFVSGSQRLVLNQEIKTTGFNSLSFSLPIVLNKNKEIKVSGFDALSAGTPSKVYNLRQYIQNVGGYSAASYGNAYLQGGVKYLELNNRGFNAAVLPSPTVINTKADQFVNLHSSSRGIAPPVLPNPNVSPRILYSNGIMAWAFGVPLVQRNPSPLGFVSTSYGTAWVSHSPRYLVPAEVAGFVSGYAKVFDPTQRVYLADRGFSGGIFGDIAVKNTRRIIDVAGVDAQAFGDWSVVESNLRAVIQSGFDAQAFGEQTIHNKTPSLAPAGFDALQVALPDIGYRIRIVKPSGFYLPKFGTAILTKPPEIKPSAINQSVIGTLFISNKTRTIFAGLGKDSQTFSEPRVWHYVRKLKLDGIFQEVHGSARIEHERRTILANGSIHSVYGNNAWVSYVVRSLSPSSITYPSVPNHRVGRTQHIQPFGYIATLFGSRIIPESQSIYPQGFINPFGLTVVDLWKKYIKPNGFLTTGKEGGHRFGTHKFWNLRQYVEMYYDADSDLTPPKWTGWTSIENKNKTIGVIGSNFARVAESRIENKARPLLPQSFDAQSFGEAMIADRVRHLKLQGLESPYIAGWSIVYNAAFVIAPQGANTQVFGWSGIANTRRYYPRIGNFESQEFGKPMIADRIRTLKFESRYAIAPPYIPIHHIDLYTRYIEEVGRFDDHQAFGNASLEIHWNVITPRWTMRDAYGTPVVKNLTPELGTRGRNSEEFGQASIRTQWRELLQQGSETVLWGRSEIAFRDRQFSVVGFTQWNVPRPKVTKTGVPPYYPQYIWLDAVEIDGEEFDGQGIEPPPRLMEQVPTPNIKTNVIFPVGFIASRYGNHHTQSNGILVQPGLQEFTIGNHFVVLRNRSIVVPSLGDMLQMVKTRPQLSPHTIYAVNNAPLQAIINHPTHKGIQYINEHVGTQIPPGEIFGSATVTLRHRKLSVGLGNQSNFSNGHKIQLRKRYINLKDFGFRSQRIGFHVLGPFDQDIVQFDSNDMQSFGTPSLSIPYGGSFFIKPNGLNSPTLNEPAVDFFNRIVQPHGTDQSNMGTRLNGDKPFMWQGLRVGELVKGNYGGFENEAFGNTFISLKVRNVEVQGFESFVTEYDYTQFDKRMRVVRQELPKQKLFIKPIGFVSSSYGVPNVKPAEHYIRPDGNADQFRKGAF